MAKPAGVDGGASVDPSARVEPGARIEAGARVLAGVSLGEGSHVGAFVTLGEPTASYYADNDVYVAPPLTIGRGALIRSHSIIYAGSTIGNDFSSGHRVTIREEVSIGDHVRLGTLCDVQDRVQIGDHSWAHSSVFMPAGTVIGNFVFIYPGVTFTNDAYPPSVQHVGAEISDFAQIGARSVVLPGVRVGAHAVVAAGAIVTRNVEPWQLVRGQPAKVVGDVRELRDDTTGEPLYPWGRRFDRGMPWAGRGFDAWLEARHAEVAGSYDE